MGKMRRVWPAWSALLIRPDARFLAIDVESTGSYRGSASLSIAAMGSCDLSGPRVAFARGFVGSHVSHCVVHLGIGNRMGTITIDNQPRLLELPAESSVAAAFEVARDEVLDRGRVVVEVKLDGTVIEWEDGSPAWTEPFSLQSALALQTEEPLTLSRGLLQRVVDSTPEAIECHRQAARLVRDAEGQAEGVELTLALLERWKDLEEVMVNVSALHKLDFAAPPWADFGHEMGAALRNITERITELREAFELGDFVLVGDLLEFELIPLSETWSKLCARFRDELREKCSK